MKKFICSLPLQISAESNKKTKYEFDQSCGFSIDESYRNPIIPFIDMNTEKDEEIEVYLIIEEKMRDSKEHGEAYRTHVKNFQSELRAVQKKVGFILKEIHLISIQSPQNSAAYMQLLKDIIQIIHDHDEVYTDITFGRKAVPIVLFIALNYATKIREGVDIATLSYGEFHGTKDPTIFDLRGFFLLNDAIENVSKLDNVDEVMFSSIDRLIELMKGE